MGTIPMSEWIMWPTFSDLVELEGNGDLVILPNMHPSQMECTALLKSRSIQLQHWVSTFFGWLSCWHGQGVGARFEMAIFRMWQCKLRWIRGWSFWQSLLDDRVTFRSFGHAWFPDCFSERRQYLCWSWHQFRYRSRLQLKRGLSRVSEHIRRP